MSLYEYERNGNAQEIIRVLRDSDNENIRERAATLLGRLEEHDDRDDIVRALITAAQNDDSDAVVGAAIDSLNDLGQDALEQLIATMADIDIDDGADWVRAKAFMQGLSSDIPELRMAAANGLGEIGDPDAVPELVERFQDGDPRVRARSARACGLINDPRATDGLESLLTDPTAAVRLEAAESLGRIGNRQALTALLKLYDDDDERVRRIAVNGFGKFSNDRPVEYLIDALADASAAVRRTAVFSLIELLSNVPTEKSHEIRETVVEQLSAVEDETVVAPLVEILERSTQSSQRRNTAWLLGRVLDDDSNRAAIEALVVALEDGEQMTRQFAATSLAEIGGTYAESELLALATNTDHDSEARAQALFTLGKIGDEETAEEIEQLLEDTEDQTVRKRAFSALSKLGGRTSQ
ncbi:HEAT repeat [Halovenus aranensis]|jgi:HEAT repeat protein|uniref:HEAT repeat n=1 Tax=Halovenus aranensis TaxID=890420 RepID=A0A1G8RM78_9EURY|nr:HEAT repeat domain-containing protein [Halovenus aranensis]SDJ18108.1 HEAT repeat [Halovenus aranensis]